MVMVVQHDECAESQMVEILNFMFYVSYLKIRTKQWPPGSLSSMFSGSLWWKMRDIWLPYKGSATGVWDSGREIEQYYAVAEIKWLEAGKNLPETNRRWEKAWRHGLAGLLQTSHPVPSLKRELVLLRDMNKSSQQSRRGLLFPHHPKPLIWRTMDPTMCTEGEGCGDGLLGYNCIFWSLWKV